MKNLFEKLLKRILSSRFLSYWVVLATDVFVSVLSSFGSCLLARPTWAFRCWQAIFC
jgi:hypothetical protein